MLLNKVVITNFNFCFLKLMKEQKNNIARKIKPLADRVLIKEDTESKEKKTSSGIIIPVTVNEDKGSKRGEVVAVGPGRVEDGELIKPSVKEGDTVLFQWRDKVRVGEEDYYLVRESEILAIIK
jgi:chaperonin GroES